VLRGLAAALSRRALQAACVAFAVGALSFLLVRLLPGDMALRIAAGRYGYDIVSAAAADSVRAELGLDRPVVVQFLDWLWRLARGDLGRSLVTGETVASEIAHQLGATLTLSLAALALSVMIGPPLGFAMGLRPGGLADRVGLALAAALRALPAFVIGIVLIVVVSVRLGALPAAGHGGAENLVLPAATLALGLAAVSSRVARDAMAAVRASPYFAFARTKGLGDGAALVRHGLRNAAVPVVAWLGVQLAALVEGVVVVESLFAWPGIGHALVHAVIARDVPMVQGTALALGLIFVTLNALVDLACLALDPRARPR
jgi:peptide/nickel transport system permease protein